MPRHRDVIGSARPAGQTAEAWRAGDLRLLGVVLAVILTTIVANLVSVTALMVLRSVAGSLLIRQGTV